MFNRKTLKFLKDVSKKDDPIWFEKNKEIYQNSVKAPFIEIIEIMELNFKNQLPHYRFSPRSLSRPMRQPHRMKDQGRFKDFIACLMSSQKTSRFEYPPGFYFSVGAKEILLGAGLYMPSSPQLRALRMAIQKDPLKIHNILAHPTFKKNFGELNPEEMKRAPRGFSVAPKYQYLLLKKSFSVHRKFSESELIHPQFHKKIVKVAQAALPLLLWIEQVIHNESF